MCSRHRRGLRGLASATNAPLSSVERHGLYGCAVFGDGSIQTIGVMEAHKALNLGAVDRNHHCLPNRLA